MSPIEILFLIVVFLYSVVLHEISHGFVAHSMGDNTARDLGRLTLNPIKHLDMFGSIILPFVLFIIPPHFIFGYAKPVPYNPLNLRDRRWGSAKVALAGPSANIILAILFGLILRFLPSSVGGILPILFGYVVQMNLLLAVFNLIPIPPLDGHWILFSLLPSRFTDIKYFFIKNGQFLFIFLLFLIVTGVFSLSSLINFLFRVIVG